MRVEFWIEYMVRNENAAEVGFASMRWTNAGREWDEMSKFVEGS